MNIEMSYRWPHSGNKPSQTLPWVERGIQWVRSHQEHVLASLGTLAIVGTLGLFRVYHNHSQNEQAWTQLDAVQAQLLQGQTQAALKALDQWTTQFQNAEPFFYSQFLRADLLSKTTDYAGAARIYAELAQNGRPLNIRPLALAAQIAFEEMAGHIPQAEALADKFLDKDHYPDHFLAASVYLDQARLAEMAGTPEKAASIYDRFILLFPQSPWTAFAKTRLQLLSQNPSKK